MRSEAKTRAPDRLDLDHFVPYKLSVLSNRVSDAIARHYSERFGLSIPEWRVMAVLGQTPGLSASEVASRTAMDKVQVSRAVASLLRAKRIARTSDEKDGRVTRLSLTRQGAAIYDEIVPLALHLESVFLAALSPAERATLSGLMDKLARQVNGLHVSALS
ncbi:MAG: MarR family transcriptional regulator [Rhizomicrobium sp.]